MSFGNEIMLRDEATIHDAADLLEAIDALHQCDPALDYECAECFHVWPCPTALLLHPEEARRG
jgi:hypothetical protein